MNSRIRRLGLASFSLLALWFTAIAPFASAFAKVNATPEGIAIHGYDPVAYFLEGRAIRGSSDFAHEWQKARWLFSSEANKKLFTGDPQRYAPQYGGFCAVCLALDGELVDANPKAWTIVDGKLYLNYSMHQRTQWRIKSNIYVGYGDEEWKKVTSRENQRATSAQRFKIAIFPFAGHEAKWSMGADLEVEMGDISIETIKEDGSFNIVYSYYENRNTPKFPLSIPNDRSVWKDSDRLSEVDEERVFALGEQHGLDAIFLFKLSHGVQTNSGAYQFAWVKTEGHLFDIKNHTVNKVKGDAEQAKEQIQRLLSDFVKARPASYRIAIMRPAFYYGLGSPNPENIGELGATIYKSIRRQSSVTISYADEPLDPSALGYLNRGGKWPFPSTNLQPNEVWKGGRSERTPSIERLYLAGKKLDLDAIVAWFYKPVWNTPEWPVEFYVIDVETQRVYVQKGKNSDASALVEQAFNEFRAGRGG